MQGPMHQTQWPTTALHNGQLNNVIPKHNPMMAKTSEAQKCDQFACQLTRILPTIWRNDEQQFPICHVELPSGMQKVQKDL